MVLIGLKSAFNDVAAMIQVVWEGISIVAVMVRLRSEPAQTSVMRLQYEA